MKKVHLLILLFSITLFSKATTSNDYDNPCWQNITSIEDLPQDPKVRAILSRTFHEGVAYGTDIKTNDGYVPVEDIIPPCITCNDIGEDQLLNEIVDYDATGLVTISCKGVDFTVGKDQRFYLSNEKKWIEADLLYPGDEIATIHGYVAVDSITPAPNDRCIAVTVKDEIYAITHLDILTHNVPAAAIQPIIRIGGLLVFHAAHAFLGVCPSIRDLHKWIVEGNTLCCDPAQFDIQLPERSYFLFRYNQLKDIRNNYIKIQKDLRILSVKDSASELLKSMATQPFEYKDPIANKQPSEEDEMHMSWEDERKLNHLRERIICQLENEIAQLQYHVTKSLQAIVVNIEVEFESLQEHIKKYNERGKYLEEITDMINDGQAALKRTISFYITLAAFDHLFQDFKQATTELEIIAKYCNESQYSKLISETSNAAATLNSYLKECKEMIEGVEKSKEHHKRNYEVCNNNFYRYQYNAGGEKDRGFHLAKVERKSKKKLKEERLQKSYKSSAPKQQQPNNNNNDDEQTICEKFGHLTGQLVNNKIARQIATSLGYIETKSYPFNSHGQLVFKKGNTYISLDKTAHKGGFWKKFDKDGNRESTMNACLTQEIGK